MKKILALMLLLSTLVFGQALDKLEQSYLSKAETLQAGRDKDVKERDAKLAKDSKRLAEAYLRSLKIMLKAETQKGDFDSAIKVKAKITEMENILKGQITRPEIVKAKEKKIKIVGELTKFNGIWEITDRNETIIYEIKDNEVWHKFIKRGSISYSTPQKVKYVIVNGILGMQHIAWEDGKPQGDKYNWIDLKNNRAIHTNQKDPSKMHGPYRTLTKIKLTDPIVGLWKSYSGFICIYTEDGQLKLYKNIETYKTKQLFRTDSWSRDDDKILVKGPDYITTLTLSANGKKLSGFAKHDNGRIKNGIWSIRMLHINSIVGRIYKWSSTQRITFKANGMTYKVKGGNRLERFGAWTEIKPGVYKVGIYEFHFAKDLSNYAILKPGLDKPTGAAPYLGQL